jgi:hypothetical protein
LQVVAIVTLRRRGIICDANIPPKPNRKEVISFSLDQYRARSLLERYFNKKVSASPPLRQACR